LASGTRLLTERSWVRFPPPELLRPSGLFYVPVRSIRNAPLSEPSLARDQAVSS
jgi:hypothetical protein